MVSVPILLLCAVLLLSGSANCGAPSPICEKGDLDGDGISEDYSLSNNVLTVTEGSMQLWQSPGDYQVDSFALGDIDNDGKPNLVISLWKKGSFGELKPFWHTEKDTSYKNHLFVYKLQEDKFRQVWCSSDLDRPILSFKVRDVDGDGRNELVVREGQYKKISKDRYTPDPDGSVRTTVWQWDEFGFSKKVRLQ
jgi:hypothetical protein